MKIYKIMILICCTVFLSGCEYREKISEEEMESRQEEMEEQLGAGGNQETGDEEEKVDDNVQKKIEEGGGISYKVGSEEDLKRQEEAEKEAREYEERYYGDYILDSHFYDLPECEFMYGTIDTDKVKMKINSAEIIEDFQHVPEYFQNSELSKERLTHLIEGGEDENGNNIDVEVPCSYVLVNLSLTNLSDRDIKEICIANFDLFKRIPDKRGLERELSDKATLQITSIMDYDYEHKKAGKAYYYFKLKEGETITTNVLYRVRKDDLGTDIYMVDGQTSLTIDNAQGEIVPLERTNIKFLKLPLEEK